MSAGRLIVAGLIAWVVAASFGIAAALLSGGGPVVAFLAALIAGLLLGPAVVGFAEHRP